MHYQQGLPDAKHSEQKGETFSTLAAKLGRKEECLTVMRPFSISQ